MTEANHREESDEAYVIDLCDQLLGLKARRQHCFDFLLGDPNSAGRRTKLPVDAYYEELGMVIEYWERQHLYPTPIMDKKMTLSGCTRGEQRKIYDRRRWDVFEGCGIRLVVLTFEQLDHTADGKLRRNKAVDEQIIRAALPEVQSVRGNEPTTD
jgi:hypothetical protein